MSAPFTRRRVFVILLLVSALGLVVHLKIYYRRIPVSLSCANVTAQFRVDYSVVSKSVARYQTSVFAPKQADGCAFHPPINIPGKGMSRICTYDPKVDTEISAYVHKKGIPYSVKDIEIMLNTMRAESRKKTTVGEPTISLVDVGCNIGLFTLSAALNGYRVLSVDAMNSSLQLLATSLRLANLTSQVTLLHNAISDSHRDVVIEVRKPNNIGASWILHDNPANTVLVSTQAMVKAICLDDLVPHVPTRRVFLKMDIEGSEWLALKCADRFFTELDVPYFHMEWDLYRDESQQPKGDALVCAMNRRGYRAYDPYQPEYLLDNIYRADWPGNILWKKTYTEKITET